MNNSSDVPRHEARLLPVKPSFCSREGLLPSWNDAAGVREIAEGAGLTAMLVNRYFGSKGACLRDVSGNDGDAKDLATSQFKAREARRSIRLCAGDHCG